MKMPVFLSDKPYTSTWVVVWAVVIAANALAWFL